MSRLIGTVGIPLKPCPLCGGEAVMETITTELETVQRYRVRCVKCGLGCLLWDHWNIASAANWWNRREHDS